MGKKRGLSLILFSMLLLLVIVIPTVLADNHTESDAEEDIEIIDTGFGAEIDQAYSCLKSNLGNNCGDTASTEQNIFSLLAMAYDSSIQSDCIDELEGKEKNDCWGKTGSDTCNLKSTAQAILALDYVGENIDDPLDWLLEKKELAEELDWFLEIDANEATSCKIKVNDANEKTFNIDEDKKFTAGSSSCLSRSEQSYHLKIDSDCLGDNFTISCDQDFISTLWYRKPGELTMFISSETHAAPAEGSTEEKVNAYCFSTSNECDYQGSLWAALALARLGEDTHMYIPYITAMADETENKKYLPSAFLYMLTNEDDYYSELVEEQQQDKYWEESNDKKFYDTALALLSLQGVNIEAVDNSEEWLLGVQETSGCWHSNNLLETAFILYASWPKAPTFADPISTRSYCSDFSYYCISAGECSLANTLDNYYCSGLSNVCCKTEPIEETCDEKDGIICDPNQRCTGSEVTSYDTNYCCLASCQVESENECELAGYFCKDSCSASQEEKSIYSGECNFGETCCGELPKKSSPWALIITLIILIVLVALAIVFREQLKIWFFRIKSKLKFGKGPKPSSRPPMPPPGTIPQFGVGRPRHMIPRRHAPVRRPPMRRPTRRPGAGAKDSAFEETMKKLRDMSK